MPSINASISIQEFTFPCAFINALSYGKACRVSTDWRGFNRFRGYEKSEISLRLRITPAVCEAAGEDFAQWVERFDSITPEKASSPSVFFFNGYPLCASLLFALTSVNRTSVCDSLGTYVYELDLVFSGVSACKEKVRDRALIFDAGETSPALPTITLESEGKSLEVKENVSVSALTVSEKGCTLSLYVGEGLKTVSRDWMVGLVDNGGTITIEGYHRFFVTSASIVDDELKITGSIFDVSYNKYSQFSLFNKTISNIFEDFEVDSKCDFTTSYLFYSGTKKELLDKIQQSSGFLIDYYNKKIISVPDTINTNLIFNYYYDDDLKTEPITGVTWYDNVNRFEVGDNAGSVREVRSVYHASTSSPAESCLRWSKIMQNEIIIEAPIDPRIRQYSAFTVIKNNTQIPVIVSAFELDFINNSMRLTLNYL